MEKIRIFYGIQGNGVSFGLALGDYNAIKARFPDAQPSKGVFVEYDFRTNFADYRPHLERYIFPTLVGLANPTDAEKIERIDFIKMPEEVLTFTIEQNKKKYQNEQEIQLVLG